MVLGAAFCGGGGFGVARCGGDCGLVFGTDLFAYGLCPTRLQFGVSGDATAARSGGADRVWCSSGRGISGYLGFLGQCTGLFLGSALVLG